MGSTTSLRRVSRAAVRRVSTSLNPAAVRESPNEKKRSGGSVSSKASMLWDRTAVL